jgi:ubiquinol-cytochrome c reductase cytochrome b subunit
MLGQLATAYYFLHFFVILPLLALMERPKPLPFSITEAVLGADDEARLSAKR